MASMPHHHLLWPLSCHLQVDSAGKVPVFICDVMKEPAKRACLSGDVGKDATVLCAASR